MTEIHRVNLTIVILQNRLEVTNMMSIVRSLVRTISSVYLMQMECHSIVTIFQERCYLMDGVFCHSFLDTSSKEVSLHILVKILAKVDEYMPNRDSMEMCGMVMLQDSTRLVLLQRFCSDLSIPRRSGILWSDVYLSNIRHGRTLMVCLMAN